jgi:CBS domain containing-hemolysin-like protein
MDEKDLTPSTIIRIDKYTIVVHGDTYIDKINNFLKVNLPAGRKTIADLVESRLKKPRIGNKVSTDEVIMIIDDIEDGKIMKIRIIKNKKFFERLESNMKK